MTRIHITCVSPRVGSTLLFEVLRTCYGLIASSAHEESLVGRPKSSAPIYLSKYPLDALRVEPSIHVDPHLYILYLIRDPRDVVCSRHGNDPEKYWVGLKYWKLFRPVYERLQDHARFVPLRYENFVRDPDKTQKRLESTLPLGKRQHRFSDYHRHVQPSEDSEQALRGVRPISDGSVGHWKDHLPRIAGQMEMHGILSDDLITLGYEDDEIWKSQLSETEPELGGSHYDEFATSEEVSRLKAGRYREALKRMIETVIQKRIVSR